MCFQYRFEHTVLPAPAQQLPPAHPFQRCKAHRGGLLLALPHDRVAQGPASSKKEAALGPPVFRVVRAALHEEELYLVIDENSESVS